MEIKKEKDGCLLKLMSVQTENKCNSAFVATLKSGTRRETLTCEPGAGATLAFPPPRAEMIPARRSRRGGRSRLPART